MNTVADKNIRYSANQMPPKITLLAYGLQQALLIATYMAMLKITLEYGHESSNTVIHAFQGALVALGLASIFQSVRNRYFGSGLLAPAVISAIYLQVSVLAMMAGGYALVLGMTIFAGIVEAILSQFLIKLRMLFTGPVIGLIVTIVGFQLGVIGFSNAIGLHPADAGHANINITFAFIVLAIIIALTIWGVYWMKYVAVLTALVVGFILILIFGVISEKHWSIWQQAYWINYPHLFSYHYHFGWHYAIPFAICGFAAAMRAMGAITTAQMINDAGWTRPDYQMIKKGVFTDGIACAISGLLGGIGLSIGPSLIGMSRASGIASRYVGFVIGAVLILLSFFPKIILCIEMFPNTILGATLMFIASFMFLAGIQIITRKQLTVRDMLTIGLAFFVGASFLVDPLFYHHLPSKFQPFTDSLLSVTTITAILLTLIFRFGIKRQLPVTLQGKSIDANQIKYHVEQNASALGVSKAQQVIAIDVVYHTIQELFAVDHDVNDVAVNLSYDQVNLTVDIYCQSSHVNLSHLSKADRHDHMLEEEAFSRGLKQIMQGPLPDKFSVTKKEDRWHICLVFFN